MKKLDCRRYWHGFCHWKGWSALGRAWQVAVRWKGWDRLFFFPLGFAVMLFLLCCSALIWVFLQGLEQCWWAYGLYAFSAYALVTLCIRFPAVIRQEGNWRKKHPKVEAFLKDEELHFRLELYRQQIINFGYGIYKILSGIVIGSAWIGADGIYNFFQALIQLFQILGRKKPGTLERQWRSYRFCGILILLMHLTLIGIVFQMVNWNRAEEPGEIMIIGTAAFAFYKFISSFVDMAKDRKHIRPVDSSVRMLELSQAVFAIFSLQAGLLRTFGAGEDWEYWINLAVGCLVCLLTVAMGIYMIRRANREIKQLQEIGYGESFL